jgi:hypothetical protein
VKKCVLHVQLVNEPCLRGADAEDDLNRYRLDNGAECLVVIDAVALGEAADDPTCFVSGKSTIGVVLVFEHPLARHDVGTGRPGNEAPGAVVNERLELLGHGRAPIWVF